MESLPEEFDGSRGELHHFQLISQDGQIPISVSVLIKVNRPEMAHHAAVTPISTNEVIQLHEELQRFDGDFIAAFNAQ